jgi:hypothetical protein
MFSSCPPGEGQGEWKKTIPHFVRLGTSAPDKHGTHSRTTSLTIGRNGRSISIAGRSLPPIVGLCLPLMIGLCLPSYILMKTELDCCRGRRPRRPAPRSRGVMISFFIIHSNFACPIFIFGSKFSHIKR